MTLQRLFDSLDECVKSQIYAFKCQLNQPLVMLFLSSQLILRLGIFPRFCLVLRTASRLLRYIPSHGDPGKQAHALENSLFGGHHAFFLIR